MADSEQPEIKEFMQSFREWFVPRLRPLTPREYIQCVKLMKEECDLLLKGTETWELDEDDSVNPYDTHIVDE